MQERATKFTYDNTRRSFPENVQAQREFVRAWQAAGMKSLLALELVLFVIICTNRPIFYFRPSR